MEPAIVLGLKIALVCGFASLVTWVAVYIRLTHGDALRNPIGQTLIVKSLLIAAMFVPTALSLFFKFNRLTSYVAGWIDVALIGLVTPVMLWRTGIFIQLQRMGELPRRDGEGRPVRTDPDVPDNENDALGGTMSEAHTEHEDEPWTVNIPGHPRRTESAEFRRAKETAHRILAEAKIPGSLVASMVAGNGIPQAHHAGSLWVHDGDGWFLLLAPCGVEWSAQFCADPAKVDQLRAAARRLYARFPESVAAMERLGYHEAHDVLGIPITDAAGVARWTDSLFNSCVMLSPGLHTGVVHAGAQGGGWHHYPKSVWDIQMTKRDDFTLWVTDEEGNPAAVAPVAHAGSGDGRVHVVYATPGSALHREHEAAAAAGQPHVLEAGHALAAQAFARQGAA